MLGNFSKEDSFILLESLLALSLVAFTLMVILPHGLNLVKDRQTRQIEVEAYRLLYDYSHGYDGVFSQQVSRNGFEYEVIKSDKSLKVVLPDEEVIEIRVVNQ